MCKCVGSHFSREMTFQHNACDLTNVSLGAGGVTCRLAEAPDGNSGCQKLLSVKFPVTEWGVQRYALPLSTLTDRSFQTRASEESKSKMARPHDSTTPKVNLLMSA